MNTIIVAVRGLRRFSRLCVISARFFKLRCELDLFWAIFAFEARFACDVIFDIFDMPRIPLPLPKASQYGAYGDYYLIIDADSLPRLLLIDWDAWYIDRYAIFASALPREILFHDILQLDGKTRYNAITVVCYHFAYVITHKVRNKVQQMPQHQFTTAEDIEYITRFFSYFVDIILRIIYMIESFKRHISQENFLLLLIIFLLSFHYGTDTYVTGHMSELDCFESYFAAIWFWELRRIGFSLGIILMLIDW